MYTNQNQATIMYPLFFDPMYKEVHVEDIDGKMVFSYRDVNAGARLLDNGDIAFAMYAPEAHKVEVSGFGGTIGLEKRPLSKGEDGWWTGTFSHIGNGFHYHRYFVDGVNTTNPAAPVTYGCFGATNFIEKPAPGQDFWMIKDVPHGDVQIRYYTSHVNEHVKQCYVYLPPSYGKTDKKYPAMYIQHGVGEDECGWIWNGKANFIMDNLIAEGKAEEMVIVMCCGYAFKKDEDPVFFPGDFGAEMVEDVIPFIESEYRIIRHREFRAMAGLSLGSAQAVQIVSRYQDRFAHLGVFSGVRYEETEQILDAYEKYPIRNIWMTGGVDEHLDVVQKPYVDRFLSLGAKGGQANYEGHHEWHVWRESLRDFASLLFKNPDITPDSITEEPVKAYKETEIGQEQYDRQTFEASMLMFDPVYKDLILAVDEQGNPAGRYRDKHHGYEVIDAAAGAVRFYYFAPEAKSVVLNLWGMEKKPMEKDEEGWWAVTVENLEQGFHYYAYFVNGAEVIDANAPVGYGGFKAVNYVDIPEENFTLDRMRPVPHGVLHQNYYKSDRSGRVKICYVYTPPAYNKEPKRRFPVVYLQHGGGENEMGWIWQGRINNIADNLIAEGKMEEMIIVMTSNYGFPEGYQYDPGLTDGVNEIPVSLVPFIDATYRTIDDRRHRAMSGLSMGSMISQKMVFDYPSLFANVGLFSGGLIVKDENQGVDYSDVLLNPEEFNKRFDVFFAACGNEEWMYADMKKAEEQIAQAGVKIYTFHAHGYHDWTFWRHCANEFLTLLFK